MRILQTNRQTGPAAAAAVAAVCVLVTQVMAQTESAGDQEDVEEIVVIHSRSGDPRDIEARNDELLRLRIQKELDRLEELEEEYEWRSSDATTVEQPSRIKWGYDPEDEMRMRQQTDLMNLHWESTKPATVFRVQF